MPKTSTATPSAQTTTTEGVDELLLAHGLRRTQAARQVLSFLLDHPQNSFTHAQLQAALQAAGREELDRVTLYRLVDRLTQVGLLLCRVDAQRTRRYQAMPASVKAIPHFECQSCHQERPLEGALRANSRELEKAAQTALSALQALGYKGLSMDVAVRGVCAECATSGESA